MARTSTGTACLSVNLFHFLYLPVFFCLSINLLIRCSSSLASSNRSLSLESTTKMIASVARVYDLQRGLVLSCPPMSQMLKIRPRPDFT